MDWRETVSPEVRDAIENLYANNEKKLHQMCHKEMAKFGGISQMDFDDFYSRVGWEISLVVEAAKDGRLNYDSSCGKTFTDYLSGVIRQAIWKELTKKNRKKRCSVEEIEIKDENGEIKKVKKYLHNLSLDTPIGEDGNETIENTLQSNFDINSVLSERMEWGHTEKVEEFLNSLPDISCKIAKMVMNGNSINEIKEKLRLTDKQYRDSWSVITSYDKKRILYRNNNVEDDEMNTTVLVEDVAETYKNTSYSIGSISKQLQKKRIRDDHILQRHSGQWKSFAKSELISDILRGKSLTQIIISEEIKNGLRMQWLIDGKQRCTTLDDFLHDGFAISKNVKNYNIRYQTVKLDESGNEVVNEDGFTEMEFKEFDIRGKKFSKLPEELQDIFKDRQIPVLYNMNCTKKDIADDIARFNRSRPMNKAQNGWLGLDECFAEFVDNIAKMQFFQPDFPGSTYTNTNNTSGAIRRIIVEGIMVSDFIDEFNNFDKMCEFLSEEASDSNFTEFYSLIERLTVICNETVSKMFDAKDSFLWFGLFSKFVNTGLNDEKFIDFLMEFDSNLRNKEVDGTTFEELCVNPETKRARATKDKNIVIQKMNHLEKLMYDFLHIEDEESSALEIITDYINPDITREDVEQYEEVLDDLTLSVDNTSKLMDEHNRPSLVAIVAYSFENDIDLDDWIVDYFRRNDMYIRNQKENYLHMKEDLEKYISKGRAA